METRLINKRGSCSIEKIKIKRQYVVTCHSLITPFNAWGMIFKIWTLMFWVATILLTFCLLGRPNVVCTEQAPFTRPSLYLFWMIALIPLVKTQTVLAFCTLFGLILRKKTYICISILFLFLLCNFSRFNNIRILFEVLPVTTLDKVRLNEANIVCYFCNYDTKKVSKVEWNTTIIYNQEDQNKNSQKLLCTI